MINEIGTLILCSGDKSHLLTLNDGMNIVGINRNEPFIIPSGQSLTNYGTVFLISINQHFIELSTIIGEILINDHPIIGSTKIKESDVISANGTSFSIECHVNSMAQQESLIDLYLDGQLPEFIDIKKMFLKYAEEIKITKKQAAFILASIDIPEMD